jgi:exodeoxyribonuclease V alpha subunit
LEPGEILSHRTYRFYGQLTQYKNARTGRTEPQFHFRSFCKVRGHGQAGTVRYLQDCPHIGKATADKLWAKFEGDAVRILRETPDVAVAAVNSSHFTETKAAEASAYLATQQAMESCTIDLIDLLGGRGFPKNTAQAAVREWGNKAAEIIRRDPYYLMQFRGCGFLKCDKMALSMGMDPARMKRQALAAWYVLASDSEGHTWKSAEVVARGIQKMIGGAECNPFAALKLAKRAKIIDVRKVTDPETGNVQVWVAEGKKARQEKYVVDRVAELLSESPAWPDFPSLADAALSGVTEHRPTTHQLEKLTQATRKAFGCLIGGPGTGKSFTTALMIKILESTCGEGQIAVCAPTGKAAVRLKSALSEYGCQTVPRTIHGLLGVANTKTDPDKRDTGGWNFTHNADNPLPHRFVFLDEGSMPSTDLMAAFLAACGKGTHVLIIGDTNQLPPIQHGAPLRDMLAAGVPYGELTEPQRNSGTIVMACCDIREGKRFRTDRPDDIDPFTKPPRNFCVIEAATPKDQLRIMGEQLDHARDAYGLDPIWDCQVIIAVNDKSPLSRKIVNKILQEKLNPHGKQVDGNPFRVGDKVICTDNGWYLCEDKEAPYADPDGKCAVSNGEFGRVLQVEPKRTVVRFEAPERVIQFHMSKVAAPKGAGKESARERDSHGAPANGEDGDTSDTDAIDGDDKKPNATGCNLELGYGCTCHKLQGSEAKFVLPLLDEYAGARRICRREWFFTGMSRGKFVTKAIGKRATADAMCRTAALPDRKTFLREDLTLALWGDL